MGMSENRAQRAVLERLFALQDTKYRAFQSKLMPTVAPETVIGVRTPLLRNLAKELAGTAEAADFLREHGMAVFAEQEDSVSYLVVPEAAHELADAMELPEAERTGSDTIRMTHEQIAQHISSAREAVARMLKQFSEEGLVELKRGAITLRDFDSLKQLI